MKQVFTVRIHNEDPIDASTELYAETAMTTPTVPFADKILTGEEFALIPGLGRCELIAGKIVTMSPTNWKHGDFVSELDWQLRSFVKKQGSGKVLTGEVSIYVRRDPDHIRGADVVFISSDRIAQITSGNYLDVAPELVVEVVSPGNTWQAGDAR